MNRTPIVGLKKFRFDDRAVHSMLSRTPDGTLLPFFLLNGSGTIPAFCALACSLHPKTEGLWLTNNFDDFDDFNNRCAHQNRHARLRRVRAYEVDGSAHDS